MTLVAHDCQPVAGRWALVRRACIFAGISGLPVCAMAWSVNELQLKYGNLDTPVFAGGGSASSLVTTIQHADSWKYGSNFFFIDFTTDDKEDGFNDQDFYGEWYPYFSIGKITGHDLSFGTLADLSIVTGVNIGKDPKVRKFLPGIAAHWKIPGFAFLTTEVEAYLDYSAGVGSGGAPKEGDSYQFDVSWGYPFAIHGLHFSVEGHIEYIGERSNELGGTTSWWILGQPQFRLDLGDALQSTPHQLFFGCQLQFWINKLGDPKTDEVAPEALLVWQF